MQTTETLQAQAGQESVLALAPRRHHKMNRRKRNEYIMGWVFIAPLTIGFLLFTAVPLVLAIYYSFTSYDLFSPPQWVWFKNFAEIFAGDTDWYMRSLLNALIFTIGVPLGAAISLAIAAMLCNISRGSTVLRMIFYIPTICGSVAITFIWQWMFASHYGILWEFLESLGFQLTNAFGFLDEERFMSSMIFMGLWAGVGGSLLLFYSSLQNISHDLYDAAALDGANGFQKFWHITMPGVSPVLFYVLLTGIVGSFQAFTQFQVMTGDVISEYSVMPVWWIYRYITGEGGYRYGLASAMGLLLGLILIVISAVQFIASKYWVKY